MLIVQLFKLYRHYLRQISSCISALRQCGIIIIHSCFYLVPQLSSAWLIYPTNSSLDSPHDYQHILQPKHIQTEFLISACKTYSSPSLSYCIKILRYSWLPSCWNPTSTLPSKYTPVPDITGQHLQCSPPGPRLPHLCWSCSSPLTCLSSVAWALQLLSTEQPQEWVENMSSNITPILKMVRKYPVHSK